MTINAIYPARLDPKPESLGDVKVAIDQLKWDEGSIGYDDEHKVYNNERRAAWAFLGVKAYTEKVYGDAGKEPVEQAISDMLGDLLHLCDALGLDFDDVYWRGRSHYEAELAGELL